MTVEEAVQQLRENHASSQFCPPTRAATGSSSTTPQWQWTYRALLMLSSSSFSTYLHSMCRIQLSFGWFMDLWKRFWEWG